MGLWLSHGGQNLLDLAVALLRLGGFMEQQFDAFACLAWRSLGVAISHAFHSATVFGNACPYAGNACWHAPATVSIGLCSMLEFRARITWAVTTG